MDEASLKAGLARTLETEEGWDTLDAGATIGPSGPAPPPPHAIKTDGYRTEAEIARGGMGVVLRAWQKSLQRPVAVKQIAAPGKDAEANFVAEALVTGLLEHPNVVPVHDLGLLPDGTLFIAMKLVDGMSWCDLLHPSTPEHEARAGEFGLLDHLDVLGQVCNALAYAHEHGFIHRDVKPENVMVGRFGEVLLMDWGLALDVREAPSDPRRTLKRESVSGPAGTPNYMAPEQARGDGKALGPRTDVYLLGATLYEVLTRAPLHIGGSILGVLVAAEASITPTFSDDVPPGLGAVCARAVARAPEDRFESVTDFADAVRAWRETHASEALARRAAAVLERCLGLPPGAALYAAYAESVAGFSEALRMWPENAAAAHGRRRALLAFAEAAVEGGDTGLAAAQLDRLPDDDADEAALRTRVEQVDLERARTARTARLYRWVAGAFALLLFGSLATGLVMVRQEQRETARQRDQAMAQRGLAMTSQREAETAMNSARDARQTARVASIVGWAQALSGRDPTLAALMLAEVADAPSANWTAAYRALLHESVARDLIDLGAPGLDGAWHPSGTSFAISAGRHLRVHGAETSRHTGDHPIRNVRWSPDGVQLMTIEGGRIRLAGREIRQLGEGVEAAWFLRDGRVLSRGARLQLWAGGRGSTISLPGRPLRVTVAGDRMAVAVFNPASKRQEVWIYDVAAAPRRLAMLQNDLSRHAVSSIAITPDGKRLAFSAGHFVFFWDTPTGDVSHSATESTRVPAGSWVYDLAWDPSGQRLASAGDRSLVFWDRGGQRLHYLATRQAMRRAVWSPSGHRVLSVGQDGTLTMRYRDGTALSKMRHPGRVRAARFHPTRPRLMTVGRDGTARVWRLARQPSVMQHPASVVATRWRPDGGLVMVNTRDDDGSAGRLHLWPLVGDQEPVVLSDPTPVWSAAFSPDGKRLAAGVGLRHGKPGALRTWTEVDGRWAEAGHWPRSKKVHHVAWSPDGKLLATGGNGRSLVLRVGEKTPLADLRQGGWIRHVTWAPRCEPCALLTSASDRRARVFHGPRWRAPAHAQQLKKWAQSGAWRPDGHQVATATAGRAILWNPRTGEVDAVLPMEGGVTDVAWSPDGRRIATVADTEVAFWDAAKPDKPLARRNHANRIHAMAWHPRNAWLATASSDRTVMLWRPDGEPALPIEHAYQVQDVAWSPDGESLLTGTRDGTAAVIRIPRSAVDDPASHLRGTVRGCLPQAMRVRYLSETEAESRAACASPALGAP